MNFPTIECNIDYITDSICDLLKDSAKHIVFVLRIAVTYPSRVEIIKSLGLINLKLYA